MSSTLRMESRLPLLVLIPFLLAPLPPQEARVRRVETGLRPPLPAQGEKEGWSIEDRMRAYNVPGVSVAVIHDFQLAWAKGYGVRDAETREPVTEATLFQASSLSMPVTAVAALKLVQEGRLSLDRNVNESLRSWKLRETDLTGKTPVTLRHLLSHSGAITIARLPGYAPGDPLPSLLEILQGRKPAQTVAVRTFGEAGKRYSYSSGGYLIVQQAISDVTGQPFSTYGEETVLRPLRMADSTFDLPLPASRASSSGHIQDGKVLPGRHRLYPETAAVGLWTTAADLARLVVDLQASLRNGSGAVLSQESARQMMKPAVELSFGPPQTVFGQSALGVLVDRNGRTGYFEQRGASEGFRGLVFAHREKGYGAVVLTNSDNGNSLALEIVRSVAHEYGWEGFSPDSVQGAF